MEYRSIVNLLFQKEAKIINDPFLVDIIVKVKIKLNIIGRFIPQQIEPHQLDLLTNRIFQELSFI